MPLNKSLLVDSAIILALILIGVIGYKLAPLLMPVADEMVVPNPGCDLQKAACSAQLPAGGRVLFSLMPQPIPVAAPIELKVDVQGIKADKVEVDFSGVSMNMGFNRQVLSSTEPGQFLGQASLPVCVSGRMAWQATVLLETGRKRVAIPFRFEAGH